MIPPQEKDFPHLFTKKRQNKRGSPLRSLYDHHIFSDRHNITGTNRYFWIGKQPRKQTFQTIRLRCHIKLPNGKILFQKRQVAHRSDHLSRFDFHHLFTAQFTKTHDHSPVNIICKSLNSCAINRYFYAV